MAVVIVTGVDGSETTGRTARTAAMLAGTFDADLLVVCPYGRYEAEDGHSDGEDLNYLSEASAQQIVSEEVLRLHAEYSEIRLTAKIEEGEAAQALVRVAENSDADIIVVGNRRVAGGPPTLERLVVDVALAALCDVYVAHVYLHP